MEIPFHRRRLAITDVETTGLNPDTHEIIEIGLVLADQQTLEVVDRWDAKVTPRNAWNAEPEALAVNGYSHEAWTDALSIERAMEIYHQKTNGTVFTAFNVSFDWDFIRRALGHCGIKDPTHYLKICLLSISWDRLRADMLESYSLDALSVRLGLAAEPKPHRALFGAERSLEVFRRLTAGA